MNRHRMAQLAPTRGSRAAWRHLVVPGVAALVAVCSLRAAEAAAGDTQLVSVSRIGNSAGGANTSKPPAVSANGRYVLYGHAHREVLLRDRWTKTTTQAELVALMQRELRDMPGQRIAFTSTRAGNSEVYVMNADG